MLRESDVAESARCATRGCRPRFESSSSPNADRPANSPATRAGYERITVRDSSLSATIQSIVAAEVGHLNLAYDCLSETAFIDLRDLAFTTVTVHLASLAGTWMAAVDTAGCAITETRSRSRSVRRRRSPGCGLLYLYRGRPLRVGMTADTIRYELLDAEPLEILDHGERVGVTRDPPRTPSRSVARRR